MYAPAFDVHTVRKFPVNKIEAQQWEDVVFTLMTSLGEVYKLLLLVVNGV